MFTSTNTTNVTVQKLLKKIGFSFSGKLERLDKEDPELFYHKRIYLNKNTLLGQSQHITYDRISTITSQRRRHVIIRSCQHM